ncbi:MAG: glutathione S-transferase [Polyangiaceae bacterium]
MLTVHHLNNSRSQRVLWMLEELGVPYEIKRYERNKKTMLAPPELLKVHPLGKSPVITDGDLTIAESGAILEYLVRTYGKGKFAPAENTPEHLRYTYWMHYAEGTLMPPLVMMLVFNTIEKTPMPFFIKPIAKGISAKVKRSFIQPNLTRNLDFIESELHKSLWFAGEELTAADVQMSFPLEGAASRGGLDSGRKKTTEFLERVHARPAYKTALEKGGPFKLG